MFTAIPTVYARQLINGTSDHSSTGITLVCLPQCSLNSKSERSSLPLVNGYRNGLLTAIIVEDHVGLLITSTP